MIDKLFKEIDAQLEVEPKGVRITPKTIIGMINKRDKKVKLVVAIVMGFDKTSLQS